MTAEQRVKLGDYEWPILYSKLIPPDTIYMMSPPVAARFKGLFVGQEDFPGPCTSTNPSSTQDVPTSEEMLRTMERCDLELQNAPYSELRARGYIRPAARPLDEVTSERIDCCQARPIDDEWWFILGLLLVGLVASTLYWLT